MAESTSDRYLASVLLSESVLLWLVVSPRSRLSEDVRGLHVLPARADQCRCRICSGRWPKFEVLGVDWPYMPSEPGIHMPIGIASARTTVRFVIDQVDMLMQYWAYHRKAMVPGELYAQWSRNGYSYPVSGLVHIVTTIVLLRRMNALALVPCMYPGGFQNKLEKTTVNI